MREGSKSVFVCFEAYLTINNAISSFLFCIYWYQSSSCVEFKFEHRPHILDRPMSRVLQANLGLGLTSVSVSMVTLLVLLTVQPVK
eukprot:scaffold2953_cov132-Skeletonema_dohrnii-CCMP3373.AAC.2